MALLDNLSNLDPELVDSVKKFEGYRASPYWDFKQYTSGYGTKANSPDESIDEATAHQRLVENLSKSADLVSQLHPDMPSGVKNALTSLTYNAGPGWINSGLGQLVKAGDWDGAKTRFLEYNKAGGEVNPGLVSRRAQEAAWFGGKPVQTAQAAPSQPMSLQAPQMPADASAIPPAQAPYFPPQPTGAAPSQPSESPGGIYGQIPAEAMPQLAQMHFPTGQRRPSDLSRLRALLQQAPRGPFSLRA